MAGIPYPKPNQPRGGPSGFRYGPSPNVDRPVNRPVPRPIPPTGSPWQQLPHWARFGGRLMPVLSLAILAYDLWRLYGWLKGRAVDIDKTVFTEGCTGGGTHFTHGTITPCGGEELTNPPRTHAAYQGYPFSYYGFEYSRSPPEIAPLEFWLLKSALTPSPQATPDSVRVTHPQPHPAPEAEPMWWLPMTTPFANPVQQPAPDMPPLPYDAIPGREPNPWLSPHEQSQRGYEVPEAWPTTSAAHPLGWFTPTFIRAVPSSALRSLPAVELANPWVQPQRQAELERAIQRELERQARPELERVPVSDIRPLPSEPGTWLIPWPVPADFPLQVSEGGPQPGLAITSKGVTVLPPARALPARPKGVEVKKSVKTVAGVVWKITNAQTESRDFIREIWKALDTDFRMRENPDLWRVPGWFPKKFGPRQSLPPVNKMLNDIGKGMRTIGKNSHKENYRGVLDLDKAVNNVIENQISDYFFGRLGRELGKASKLSRRPIGYGAGEIH